MKFRKKSAAKLSKRKRKRTAAGSGKKRAGATGSKRTGRQPVSVKRAPEPVRATRARTLPEDAITSKPIETHPYELPWPKPPPAQPSRRAAVPEPPTARADRLRRNAPESIPPILLDRDTPSEPAVGGPGERYALGPLPSPSQELGSPETAELPESYGTGRLFLAARDPHSLYAAWDLAPEQQQEHNRASIDGHLFVRVYFDSLNGPLAAEAAVHPESRNWFLHVDRPGQNYVAELGYRSGGNEWNRIASSDPAFTPPDRLSEDSTLRFASPPVSESITLDQLLNVVESAAREHVPIGEAVQQIQVGVQVQLHEEVSKAAAAAEELLAQRAAETTVAERATPIQPTETVAAPGPSAQPAPMDEQSAPRVPSAEGVSADKSEPAPQPPHSEVAMPSAAAHALAHGPRVQFVPAPEPLSPAKERQLAELVRGLEAYRQVWTAGSIDITELVRKHLEITSPSGKPVFEVSQAMPVIPAIPAAGAAPGSPGIPTAAGEQPGEFWFNVNAEIVIYGATEPDATVTIAGRRIQLRPDGTFSYRFALPDGKYALPITATAWDQSDQRSANLQFLRATDYSGDVGQHPQSAELKPPLAESL